MFNEEDKYNDIDETDNVFSCPCFENSTEHDGSCVNYDAVCLPGVLL